MPDSNSTPPPTPIVPGDRVEPGIYVPPQMQEQFTWLRTILNPTATLARLDVYAKWLFASAAIVGTLGAGFANSSLSGLHGFGVWSFAIAVVALGGCLMAGSLSIAPYFRSVDLNDTKAMWQVFEEQVGRRRLFLRVAAVLFASALFLAAISPFVSLAGNGNPALLRYSVDEKGVLDAVADVSGFHPGEILKLRVDANATNGALPPMTGTTIDRNGNAKLTLHFSNYSLLSSNAALVLCLSASSNAACNELQRVTLKP